MNEAERIELQRHLAEEFGLLHEQLGATRMAGRIAGWLLMCDPPVQSLTQIAEALGVSKAAVSGAVRLLLQTGGVEQVCEPGARGDWYRAATDKMDSVLRVEQVTAARRLLERALATVADRDQAQSNYAIMRDTHDFLVFLEAELPGLKARWENQAIRRARQAAADTNRENPELPGGIS